MGLYNVRMTINIERRFDVQHQPTTSNEEFIVRDRDTKDMPRIIYLVMFLLTADLLVKRWSDY